MFVRHQAEAVAHVEAAPCSNPHEADLDLEDTADMCWRSAVQSENLECEVVQLGQNAIMESPIREQRREAGLDLRWNSLVTH